MKRSFLSLFFVFLFVLAGCGAVNNTTDTAAFVKTNHSGNVNVAGTVFATEMQVGGIDVVTTTELSAETSARVDADTAISNVLLTAIQPNDLFITEVIYGSDGETNVVADASVASWVTASAASIQGFGCLSTYTGEFNRVTFPRLGLISNTWNQIVCEVRSVTYAGTEQQDLTNSSLIFSVTNTLYNPQPLYTNVVFDLPATVTSADIDDALLCITYAANNGTKVGWAGRPTSGTMPTRITSKLGVYYVNGALTVTSSTNFYNVYALSLVTESQTTNIQAKLVGNLEPFDIQFNDTYAVEGLEANVYFDNLIPGNWADYGWDVDCSVGTQQVERWTWVPSGISGVTTNEIVIKCYDKVTRYLLSSVTGSVYAASSSTLSGVTNSLLMIGDSTTAHNTYPRYVYSNGTNDAMVLDMVGTKADTVLTNAHHEGYSGWTIESFFTSVDSPFRFSGVFNFATYLATNSIAAPDYVVINLGINSLLTYGTDADVLARFEKDRDYYNSMIDSIRAADPTIKIGIGVTQPPSYTQDAFGKNYAASYVLGQSQIHCKHNIIYYGALLASQFGGREDENIYIVPVNQCLDTVNNMLTESVPVNARNSTTVVRQSNGVHPAASGYAQLADGLFSWLKYDASK